MTDSILDRVARVRRWLDRLRPLADGTHPLGRAARLELAPATGLSAENVEWALTHAFEVDASAQQIRQLVEATVVAPCAHVLLSANVFVGALRAIAIAVASSDRVKVRASRREPKTADLLLGADPEAFQLVTSLEVQAGEHVWAYGSDTTLSELRATLPRGATLHAHGDGYGVFLVEEVASLGQQEYAAMALDVAAFDQRGCLSPRYALLPTSGGDARLFARRLLAALDDIQQRIPFGRVDAEARATTIRHRETWRYLGDVFESGAGLVTLDTSQLPCPPPNGGRTVHVRVLDDPKAELVAQSARITAVGCLGRSRLVQELGALMPQARVSRFGQMQCPALDGPVDRRTDPQGWLLD